MNGNRERCVWVACLLISTHKKGEKDVRRGNTIDWIVFSSHSFISNRNRTRISRYLCPLCWLFPSSRDSWRKQERKTVRQTVTTMDIHTNLGNCRWWLSESVFKIETLTTKTQLPRRRDTRRTLLLRSREWTYTHFTQPRMALTSQTQEPDRLDCEDIFSLFVRRPGELQKQRPEDRVNGLNFSISTIIICY